MLDTLDWKSIDKSNEEAFENNVVYKRKKNAETVPISCAVCKNLISTIEDIETANNSSCCNSCNDIYFIPNKEKWLKGWRPIIINNNEN